MKSIEIFRIFSNDSTMIIRDRKQIAARASPVRLALVDALEGMGPASVAELACVTGSRADGLYYHLRILEKRGLVARRSGADAPQAIVDVAARPLLLAYEPADRKNRDAVTRVVAAMLRAALRLFRAAFRPPVRVKGKHRELWAAQRTAALTKTQLETVNRLLNGVLDEFSTHGDAVGEPVYSITFVLAPQGK
jgi:predicted transcriptional regulator